MIDQGPVRPKSIFGLIAAMLQVRREMRENKGKVAAVSAETTNPPAPDLRPAIQDDVILKREN